MHTDSPLSPSGLHGLFDLHCHLLPDIDDGCVSVKESLQCIQILKEHGYVGSVCTPHVLSTYYPANVPERIEAWVANLREKLHEEGIDYQLLSGAEVRLSRDGIDWMEQHGVPTLGDGDCVLIDSWDADWPSFADEIIDYLIEHRYQPILAHPERMNLYVGVLEALHRLIERGVWLQGNLNSLAGGEGGHARKCMQRWLDEDLYTVFATDMHRPHQIDGRMTGINLLVEEVGEEKATLLLIERPQQILRHSFEMSEQG